MLIANRQEYETLKEFLPPDTQVDSDIGTDFIIQGIEKNRSFERKDLRDFMHSIRDGRLFEQLKELSNNKEEYEPFIIIEGLGFWDVQSHKYLNLKAFFETYPEKKLSFYEALVAFRSFSVGLVWTMDKADTALFLTYENTKLGKPKVKKEYLERRGMKSDWSLDKQRLYFYEAVGASFAKVLASSTLKDLLNSPLSKEELLTKLPKTYASGRTIPSKYLNTFVTLLGFE